MATAIATLEIGVPTPSVLGGALCASRKAQAPPELRQALDVIGQHVDDYIDRARLGKAV